MVEQKNTPEEWRVIAHAPNYAISSLGRVKRLAPGTGTFPGKVLALANTGGYMQVNLSGEGGVRSCRVHILVAEAFVGPRPTITYQVAHRDGNRANNRVENLRWATPLENAGDDLVNGSRPMGASHPAARLTEEDVAAIRREYTALLARVCERHSLSTSHVKAIISGKAWATRRHAQPPALSAER